MVEFLAIRCFSCQTFQVNQKTKSCKWKCRLCGEGQSIVKVWGRGGHARDVRGLVMELNAVAGRGEDPNIVLRNRAGGSGLQSLPSLSQRPQARDNRNLSGGMRGQDDGCDFSMNGRAAPRRRQYTGGAGELRSVEPATWTRSEGFVPAGLPSGGGGDPTAVGSWDARADKMAYSSAEQQHLRGERRSPGCLENPQEGPAGYGGYNARGGVGFETHPEHTASTSQQFVGPPGVGSRGGSRWGVFASDEAMQVLKRRQGPGQQVEGDANFVTSIETAPARRRASPTPERRGRKRAPPSSSGGHQGRTSEEGGVSKPRWARGEDQQEEVLTCVATDADVHERDPWRQNKSRRRERSSSRSIAPRADQADPPMDNMWGGGREQGGRDPFETNRGGGGGMPGRRGMFRAESNGGSSSTHGGVRGTASSSSSRWSKFIR